MTKKGLFLLTISPDTKPLTGTKIFHLTTQNMSEHEHTLREGGAVILIYLKW